MNTLNEMAAAIHANNVEKGFYESDKNTGEMLALIHSEVSEALECDRNGKFIHNHTGNKVVQEFGNVSKYVVSIGDDDLFKFEHKELVKDHFEAELVDTIIRCLDLLHHKGCDIDNTVKAVMRYNSLRPYKHAKKY